MSLQTEIDRLRSINAKLVENFNSLLVETARQEDEIKRLRQRIVELEPTALSREVDDLRELMRGIATQLNAAAGPR